MNMYQSINQTNEFPVSSLNCFCVSCYPKTMTNYQHYSLYHINVMNKLIHLVTIPIIMITTAHFIQKFHIVFDDEEIVCDTTIGNMILFPSKLFHQAKPVLEGVRYSMVYFLKKHNFKIKESII